MKKSATTGATVPERMLGTLGFFLLFPGFFFYHTLLGTGTTGAFLGGYFTPVSLPLLLPLCVLYGIRIKRDRLWLSQVDLYFAGFMAYFSLMVAVNPRRAGAMDISSSSSRMPTPKW